MEELGLEYIAPDILPSAVQQKIQEVQDKIANILGNNEAIITTRVYKINNSEAKGREFQKAYCENLLMGFNAYYEKKKKAITSQVDRESCHLATRHTKGSRSPQSLR